MGIKAIAFDLNGTLLDMSALDRTFERVFGAAACGERWFGEMQTMWMATIPTLKYQPFDKIARAALEMLSKKEGVVLPAKDAKEVLERMTKLPAFRDVRPGLDRLKKGGYRLAALTNGTLKIAKSQLKAAKIEDFFDDVHSADEVEQFKPGPKPYLNLAKELAVKPSKILMVAAHHWDLEGAHEVGCCTAFIERPKQVLNPLGTKPDYVAADLEALARQLE